MRTILVSLVLAASLALAGCSGAEPPRPTPVELPTDPPGTEPLDAPTIETQLDTILLSAAELSGTWVGPQRLLELTDTDRDAVIAHYDQAFSADGWETVEDAAITRSLGRTWERDGHKVVLSLVTIDGTQVALLFDSPE